MRSALKKLGFSKQGIELTLTTIVIAIVVLLVGGILIYIGWVYIKKKGADEGFGGLLTRAKEGLEGAWTGFQQGVSGGQQQAQQDSIPKVDCNFNEDIKEIKIFCDIGKECGSSGSINTQYWKESGQNTYLFSLVVNKKITNIGVIIDSYKNNKKTNFKNYKINDFEKISECQYGLKVDQKMFFKTNIPEDSNYLKFIFKIGSSSQERTVPLTRVESPPITISEGDAKAKLYNGITACVDAAIAGYWLSFGKCMPVQYIHPIESFTCENLQVWAQSDNRVPVGSESGKLYKGYIECAEWKPTTTVLSKTASPTKPYVIYLAAYPRYDVVRVCVGEEVKGWCS